MSIYSLVISRYNLKTTLKLIKCFTKEAIAHKNRFSSMSQKTSPKTNYVAVNVPEVTKAVPKKRIWLTFRKKSKAEGSADSSSRLKKSDLMRLFSLAKPEKYKLMGAIGLLIVSSSVTMAIPFSLGKVLDVIYTNSSNISDTRSQLNRLGGILIGVFLLGAVCNFGRVYLMSASGYRMTQALRTKVFNSILKQEQAWFDGRSTGELVNRLSSDTQIVGQALSSNISDGLRSCAMVGVGTGMMFYMSPELALVGLSIVPPVACMAVVYGRFVRNITRKVQDSLAETTKVAEERIGNVRTVKSFGHEYREMDRYEYSIRNLLTLAYKEAKARAIFYGMAGFTGNMIIISVLYYGGVMVSSQSISVGQLSSFLLYAAYIGISVGGLSSFYSEINKSVGAASRIWEIIDREPLIPIKGGYAPLTPPEGKIVFKNIQFSYPSRPDTKIFENLLLEIKPGQMVAVVGPSGSGKTTLASLLLRLYDPNAGEVYVDDYVVRDLDPSWLRRYMGVVSQEPVLFSTSIRENILYGAEDPDNVTEESLIKIAKQANVHEFVQDLPDGYETLVGERGVMLSGGQKQRVAIARALIKDPKILLLDEATSALDAQSEHLVQEALERVMKGRTVLTIAHRLSTIQNADMIAVLQKGKIVETGTYDELVKLENGAFNELMKHQTFRNRDSP